LKNIIQREIFYGIRATKRLIVYSSFLFPSFSSQWPNLLLPLIPAPPPNLLPFNIPHMNHSPSIKLTKDNYMAWQFQLLAYLQRQDVYGFIEGTVFPPVQLIVNPVTTPGAPVMIANPEYLSWYQRDQLIISVLVSTLSDSYVSHAVGCTTSRALWESLEKMFASQAHAWIMQVHFQLATLKKGNSSITNYFHKLKTPNDTLAACGQLLNDFEAVSFLLARLGFDPLVTSVTTRVDHISRDDIYGLLLAHEMRLEQQLANIDISNATAHVTTRNSGNSGQRDRSFNTVRGHGFPNGRGYRAPFPGGRGQVSGIRGRGHARSSRPLCQICNKLGHYATTCYQRFDQTYQKKNGLIRLLRMTLSPLCRPSTPLLAYQPMTVGILIPKLLTISLMT
jgi:hypothetical protein